MKGKAHRTEEIIRILRQADGGETAQWVCRAHNISYQTFYSKSIGAVGKPGLGSKFRIWNGERVKPNGVLTWQTERCLSDRLADRSADRNNGIAHLKKPDPTRAAGEDEPLRSPEDRPLSQPRSNKLRI